MHSGGSEEGMLKWIETGNKGDKWQQTSVSIKHKEAFWVIMNLHLIKVKLDKLDSVVLQAFIIKYFSVG